MWVAPNPRQCRPAPAHEGRLRLPHGLHAARREFRRDTGARPPPELTPPPARLLTDGPGVGAAAHIGARRGATTRSMAQRSMAAGAGGGGGGGAPSSSSSSSAASSHRGRRSPEPRSESEAGDDAPWESDRLENTRCGGGGGDDSPEPSEASDLSPSSADDDQELPPSERGYGHGSNAAEGGSHSSRGGRTPSERSTRVPACA